MVTRSASIRGDKQFRIRSEPTFTEAEITHEWSVLAHVGCAADCEADLALCLSALVEAGVINIEKLRAALILAEPVAREHVVAVKEPT
jgi:hypothetical protein